MSNIIEVKNLTKKYNSLVAVDNISFSVKKGEIFGLLGENGAGKTTTLEIIEGLRKSTNGEIKVLGMDVRKNLLGIKERIGVQLQSSAYYEYLQLHEILELFGSFYNKEVDTKKLFKMVGLENKKDQYIKNLSGGQKQRFSIIASLINDPEIVFLDEPTTGLDPLARRHTWDIISEIKKQGKTLILTTHYMEEAEMLCDRVAIMEKGKIMAMDKTHELIGKAKHPYKIEFILEKDNPKFTQDLEQKCAIDKNDVKKLPGKTAHYEMKLHTQSNLNKAVGMIQKQNPESLTVGQTTLEDLFIELTGKSIEEEEGNNA
ncbi:MAG: ABC transporter ATP-binding protein [Candidatus Berkelbacteria bacterium]|nr:ABC transporter ATP-binding protein [Candidatus Berkelbacteria bacterium]